MNNNLEQLKDPGIWTTDFKTICIIAHMLGYVCDPNFQLAYNEFLRKTKINEPVSSKPVVTVFVPSIASVHFGAWTPPLCKLEK